MPKKEKKAKTPLSDEEQLLLFQQKLLAEEEMAKKKERLLSQFLKVMAFCIMSCSTPSTRCSGLSLRKPHFHPDLPSSGNPETQIYLDFRQHCLGGGGVLRETWRGCVVYSLAVSIESQNWDLRSCPLSQLSGMLIFSLEMGHYKQHPTLMLPP